MKVVPETCHAH